MIKVIDDFLPSFIADRISDIVLTPEFPWYYHDHISYSKPNELFWTSGKKYVPSDEEAETLDRFQFVHTFKSNISGTSSVWFDRTSLPIIDKLELPWSKVFRAKVNLSLYTGSAHKSAFHVDNAEPHKVALYYVNTNNGYTEFETGEKITCKKNRIVLFDGQVKHRSIKQTDTKQRIAININYT